MSQTDTTWQVSVVLQTCHMIWVPASWHYMATVCSVTNMSHDMSTRKLTLHGKLLFCILIWISFDIMWHTSTINNNNRATMMIW